MAQLTISTTKNHDEIKKWIKKYNGTPARLGYDSTGEENDTLTVWFREEKEDVKQSYQALDWKEFFAVFDNYDYTFKYNSEEKTERYCEFIKE